MNLFNTFVKRVNNLLLASMLGLFLLPTTSTSQNCARAEFRSIDGSCNNLKETNWGKAHIPFVRELPAVYEDGVGKMITSRPNPRYISNKVFQQVDPIANRNKLSSFVFTWGQFIDHDLDITHGNRREPANIPLPADEPDFTQEIAFGRSATVAGTGVTTSREHPNAITAWMDASNVYGSDQHRADWLRTFKNGKLKTSKGNYLPYNTIDGEKGSSIDAEAPGMDDPFRSSAPHFVAGDSRASEQPGLTILHTLFLREHNRICDELAAAGMNEDERIYQTARKKVNAIIQHITYTEFLPALGIKLASYKGYNPNARPDIMHVFATAAYRVGHTMVTEDMLMMTDDCKEIRHPLSLGEAFFNARWIEQYGIEPIIKGLATQKQELINAQIVNSLRNSLFNTPRLPAAIGLDLAAINIQRGRDHGMPDYNTIRAHFTGKKAATFTAITKDQRVSQALAEVYNKDINNIDAWVGMLAEDHYQGGNVGITIYYVLKEQFERLRDGDFYYFENDPFLSKADLRTIKSTTLSTVIQNNTPYRVQSNVFRVTDTKCNTATTTSVDAVDLCQLRIVVADNSLTITKPANAAPYFQVFTSSWKAVYSCMQNCGEQHEIKNLKKGTYRIITYDRNRKVSCTKKIKIGGKKNPLVERPQDSSSRSFPKANTFVGSNLFPNPAKQVAYLTLKNYIGHQASITIYNNFGQVIRQVPAFEVSESVITLPVQDLTAGIYHVQVVLDDNTIKTHKMIIQQY